MAKATSYADDTRVIRSISCEKDVSSFQRELEKIYRWAEETKMVFNESKFEHMRYNSSDSISNLFFPGYKTGDGSNIKTICSTKDLGILQSNGADYTEQIETLKTKGRRMAGWILRTFKTRERRPMLILFKSLVLPVVEYCSLVWSPGAIEKVREVESVQRSFTSNIIGLSDINYWDRLCVLDLYSLERRRERFAILHVFKILKGLAPNFEYESYKIVAYTHIRLGLLCRIPPLKSRASSRLKTLKDRSFSVIGPKLFNCAPAEVRNLEKSFDCFKNKVDKWLSGIPDRPCLNNYDPQNVQSNSIISQIRNMQFS